ncbi:hypothetical protein NP603_12235 [Methylomonas sp. SURF-1]|uniref:Uncharacterized protein n=1 Tax=Methylomonas aurea TaxID=2952224 RepID=A0ABT1UJ67_9GAMM|nr:hypothetical protein [Methylomonas sp. SURF-1]MCQ8181878.1 hypothetical protein [Methylomonas sp. SURF-1]
MHHDLAALRDAIIHSPLETSNFGEEPAPGTLYVPSSHVKALRLDANVVVGGRGVGKSFWTSALRSTNLRSIFDAHVPELTNLEITVGFSNREEIALYPNEDGFAAMLDLGFDPYDVWRAVIMRWIAHRTKQAIPSDSWQTTVSWLKQRPEDAAKMMQAPRDWRGLIIFDALDRTSNDWRRMDEIVRGLLKAVLWLKSFPGLFAKVFLREDQAERTVFNFPDASKLLATKAELSWQRHDLHGLLWQRLINAPDDDGQLLRNVCESVSGAPLAKQLQHWQLSENMKREGDVQRGAFELLAGPWMGKDKRRGVPYTWSVSHLADGRGLTSPRSFLAAIRQAAEDSRERYPSHEFTLHYESIKRGIQKASQIRVAEVAEDYPWVQDVLSALEGLNVPADYDTIRQRWEDRYPIGPQGIGSSRLPAQHADRGWEGIRDDLARLGLIKIKTDGRIDMPDIYRVGFGLGRKGGVKPGN